MSELDFAPLYPNIPQPRQPSSNSRWGVTNFETPEEFEDELFRHAIEVCRIICPSYWHSNRNIFSVSSKTAEDLAQSVIENTWVKRYQKLVQSDPDQFTIESFRKRFYISARRVCSIQNRYHRAKCRHDEEHWVSEITGDEQGLSGLAVSAGESLSPTASRLLLLSSFHLNEINPLKKASETLMVYLGPDAIDTAINELQSITTNTFMNQQLRQELDEEWNAFRKQISQLEPLSPATRDELLQEMVLHHDDPAAMTELKKSFISGYLPLAMGEISSIGTASNWKPSKLAGRLVKEFGKELGAWVSDCTKFLGGLDSWNRDGHDEACYLRFNPAMPTGESAFERLKVVVRKVIYSPNPDEMMASRKTEICDLVTEAKASGQLRQKTPHELSVELVTNFFESLPPALHQDAYRNLIEQLSPNPSGEVKQKRLKNLIDHSRGLVLADYRILSEFLGIPVNQAASPVIILRAANERITKMPGLEIPSYIKEVLDAIRVAVLENPSRTSLAEIPASLIPSSETIITQRGSSVATIKNLSVNRVSQQCVEVYPIEGQAALLWQDLNRYSSWPSWLTSLNLSASLNTTGGGGKILLEGEWINEWSAENIRAVLMGVIKSLRHVGTSFVAENQPPVSSPLPSVKRATPTSVVTAGSGMNFCKCGCGAVLTRAKGMFLQGHNMRKEGWNKATA